MDPQHNIVKHLEKIKDWVTKPRHNNVTSSKLKVSASSRSKMLDKMSGKLKLICMQINFCAVFGFLFDSNQAELVFYCLFSILYHVPENVAQSFFEFLFCNDISKAFSGLVKDSEDGLACLKGSVRALQELKAGVGFRKMSNLIAYMYDSHDYAYNITKKHSFTKRVLNVTTKSMAWIKQLHVVSVENGQQVCLASFHGIKYVSKYLKEIKHLNDRLYYHHSSVQFRLTRQFWKKRITNGLEVNGNDLKYVSPKLIFADFECNFNPLLEHWLNSSKMLESNKYISNIIFESFDPFLPNILNVLVHHNNKWQDGNVKNKSGETLLMLLLKKFKTSQDDVIFGLCKTLLASARTLVDIKDRSGRSCIGIICIEISKSCYHFQSQSYNNGVRSRFGRLLHNRNSSVQKMLQLLIIMARHPRASPAVINEALMELSDIYASSIKVTMRHRTVCDDSDEPIWVSADDMYYSSSRSLSPVRRPVQVESSNDTSDDLSPTDTGPMNVQELPEFLNAVNALIRSKHCSLTELNAFHDKSDIQGSPVSRTSAKCSVSFGHLAALGQLPLDIFVNHPDFDAGVKSASGDTVLHTLVQQVCKGKVHPSYEGFNTLRPDLEAVLAHPKSNVTCTNKNGETVADVCIIEYNAKKMKVEDLLHIIATFATHQSASSAFRYKAISCLLKINRETSGKLENVSFPDGQAAFFMKSIFDICSTDKFNINFKDDDNRTISHIAALHLNKAALEIFLKVDGADINAQDREGNTVLYYVLEKFPMSDVCSIVKNHSWDLSLRNQYDETACDFCETFSDNTRKVRLKKLLGDSRTEQRTNREPSLSRKPVDRAKRNVSLEPVPKSFMDQYRLVKYAIWKNDIRPGCQRVYPLFKAKKGKVLIICNSSFEVPWLKNLEGYQIDKASLTSLWLQLGYDVFYAASEGDYALTAEEMDDAVKKFSAMTVEEDGSCVLNVLSHGGSGFLYGKDGKECSVDKLLRHLNNEICPQMMKKPKIIVLQACNGENVDSGICDTAGGGCLAEPAGNAQKIPIISDRIICYPSLAGYKSYVYKTPGRGSVFIEKFIEVFQNNCHEVDIDSLLKMVNAAVSEEAINVENCADDFKQMPEYKSNLCKDLYFLPCEKGEDWASSEQLPPHNI